MFKIVIHTVYITRQYTSVIKVGVVCMGITRVSICLQEELVWATDKNGFVLLVIYTKKLN